jgi:L-alanine-DL-glutamate epimerase-like enolase superfamily enzyme
LKISKVEQLALDLPFHERVKPHMARALTHWTGLNLFKVYTDNGLVGVGETLGRRTSQVQRDFSKYVGKNPCDFLFDDSEPGIQMALFDVLGKHLGVPAYKLLGQKVRDYVPISWWSIDMPSEDWVGEAKRAFKLGYRSHKIKARPWRDIVEQVDDLCGTMPKGYRLDVDFNSFLLTAGKGVRILKELEQYANVECFESPIPQNDIEGYKLIHNKVNRRIAMHFGMPPPLTAIRENLCDVFVIGGPVGAVIRQAAIAAEANKQFWLQMVGSGITTAFLLHMGGVLSHATYPAITCHELWLEDLITERIEVHEGYAKVPEEPGLGIELDEAATEKYRTPIPKPEERQVITIEWPDGTCHYYPDEREVQRTFYAGNEIGFESGVQMKVVTDDGTKAFDKLYKAVQLKPIWHR